ncbi:hypothetical protein DMUE_3104 [Dictyocoela muelleri]|nr:hypothetical protein DMUE_3104 [Dictyocoela muelleri]
MDLHLIIREKIMTEVKNDSDLLEVFDENYIKEMYQSGSVASELEIFLSSKLFSLNINLYYRPYSTIPINICQFGLQKDYDYTYDILKYKSHFYIKSFYFFYFV